MKDIPLHGKYGKGYFALVDDEDYEEINKFIWFRSREGYAIRSKKIRKKLTTFYMHRIVAKTPDGLVTDHINGNRLDNRKNNLRVCTMYLNGLNRGASKNNTTGLKGVTIDKRGRKKKYIAQLTVGGKRVLAKYFYSPEEAHAAYIQAWRNYVSIKC